MTNVISPFWFSDDWNSKSCINIRFSRMTKAAQFCFVFFFRPLSGKHSWWFMIFKQHFLSFSLPSCKYMTQTYDTYLFFSSSVSYFGAENRFIKTDRHRDILRQAPLLSCSVTPNSCQWFPAGCGVVVLLGEEEHSAGSRLWLAHRPRALLNPFLLPWPNPTPPPLFICLICGKTHKHLCMICGKQLIGVCKQEGCVCVCICSPNLTFVQCL